MRTSLAGIALIKRFEGCRLEAYLCPADVPTIGYGSTFGVRMGDRITQEEAERRLRDDLVKFECAVEDALSVPVGSPAPKVTQNQFDAMVSLCYNIGPGNFRTSSVIRRFVRGDIAGAADAFLMWNKAGGQILPGLVKRRKAEVELFLGVQSMPEGA
jgi:lysozyme